MENSKGIPNGSIAIGYNLDYLGYNSPYIDILFSNGFAYRYTNYSAGAVNMSILKSYALCELDLNDYIEQHCRYNYESVRPASGTPETLMMYIQYVFAQYIPKASFSRKYEDNGWFEQIFTYPIHFQSMRIDVEIYVHWDRFDHDNNKEPTIFGTMGFRIPYIKSIWDKRALSSTMLFKVTERPIEKYIEFVYNTHYDRYDFDQAIPKFAADLEHNLNANYRVIIAQYNGLIPL